MRRTQALRARFRNEDVASLSRNSRSTAARLKALQQISIQLIGLKDNRQLLHSIVRSSMDLLVCDAASLFLSKGNGHLYFEIALNDSIDYEFEQVKIPLSRPGIATYVFANGESLKIKDVYRIPASLEGVIFDPMLDHKLKYRTRSVLAVPLKNSRGEILGVLQLLNKKSRLSQAWPSESESALARMPVFNQADVELLESFAAVAGASLENQGLREEIEGLFESFVKASVVAIDSRDPGTRGHSVRVAHLTLELARAISDSTDADLADIKFSDDELKELLWAGYVHDFGKISVRESTLQKDQKLTEIQRLHIERRVQDGLLAAERKGEEGRDLRRSIEKAWSEVLEMSRPAVLETRAGIHLERLAAFRFEDSRGELRPLLEASDIASLEIARGCLTPEERAEIEHHVTQSYEFLRRIPWGPKFRLIPEIAYCHHELLDGSGYPRKLRGDQIPVRARIMTICDIFDALSASDRVYKAALPLEKTLWILKSMVDRGQLDARFYQIFVRDKIWETLKDATVSEPLMGFSKIAA
jgi:HD-GYP domain-containing protein (c-di-GMP phosphodiesterase class II)